MGYNYSYIKVFRWCDCVSAYRGIYIAEVLQVTTGGLPNIAQFSNPLPSDRISKLTWKTHHWSTSSSTFLPSPASLPTRSPRPTLFLSPTTPEWCEDALASLKPRCAGLDLIPSSPLIIPSSALIAARSVISSLLYAKLIHCFISPL